MLNFILIFTTIIVILAICFNYVRRFYKIPSLDTIKEIVSNSSISGIEITSKFFKIKKLSYFKIDTPVVQTQVYLPPEKPFFVIKSEEVGYFHRTYYEEVIKAMKEKKGNEIENIKKPLVIVGQIIEVGDVVGVTHAMHLDSKMKSKFSGRIIKILVDDNTPVEFGQPIMHVEQI